MPEFQSNFLVNDQLGSLYPKNLSLPEDADAIFLDKNELPYMPSSKVIKEIVKAATKINRYPEVLHSSLRIAVANYVDGKKEQIFIGNGSDGLIELLIKVFVTPKDSVIIPIPTFFVYQHATQVAGGNPIFVNRTSNFSIDTAKLLEKVTDKVKIIFIANPNNPTANLISRDSILEILNNVRCIVVVDECYYEFCQETVVDLVEKYPNLIVLRSFSKSFGLAGLRVGYGIASEAIVNDIYQTAQMFPVNRIALAAALAALEDLEYLNSNIKKICLERKKLTQNICKLGLFVYPSETNFLFIKTDLLGVPSRQIVDALQNRNIFVKDFGLKLGLDGYYLRISVGTSSENQALIKELGEVVVEIKTA